jgi:20S proteasome alpha/beta subunit
MTILIATICDSGNSIVLVGDREVGVGFTSAEFSGSKFGSLYLDWSVGIAGTVSNALDVYNAAARRGEKIPSLGANDVRGAVEGAYREARLHQAEARFLANRGWTLKEFIDHGTSKLPLSTYANIDAQIANFDFNTDLIFAGFGEGDSLPSIYTITNPGVCSDHSKLGFWCVGSGSPAAQMSLFAREFSADLPAETATYFAYEAKLQAERATGVGTQTDIYLFRKEKKKPTAIGDQTRAVLEKIWNELKPKKFESSHLAQLQMCEEFVGFRKP